MNDEAVVNASPLIFLSRGGHFDLLRGGMYLSRSVLDGALALVGE